MHEITYVAMRKLSVDAPRDVRDAINCIDDIFDLLCRVVNSTEPVRP